MGLRWTCPNGHTGDTSVCPQCGAPCEASTVTPITVQPPPNAWEATLALPTAANAAPSLGEVPGYELLEEIGRGGMGVVYKARHLRLKHKLVALKMILSGARASRQELQRFHDEAEAVARLQHDNIVHIFDVGEADGQPYLALEYVDGGSLAQLLQRGPLSPREAALLVATLARAMEHAHQRGVIHRDLKPANVLLASGGRESPGTAHPGDSRPPLAKITDFGLARNVNQQGQTQTGVVMGTPAYMAPEQARGHTKEITPLADVYALGAILYECLTGQPPFVAESALDVIVQVASDEPLPPRKLRTDCPRDLETICVKCLEKSPARRYDSARALAEDLDRYLAGEPILARPVGPLGRFTRWCVRQPAFACTLLGLSLFYVNHLVLMAVGIEGEGGNFHIFVSVLLASWLAGAWAFQRLQRRAGWTRFAVFAWCALDVVCLTLFLWQAHGPTSSLAPGYLLLIAGAALRGQSDLVWFITGLSVVGYAVIATEAGLNRQEIAVTVHRAIIYGIFLVLMGWICHLQLRRSRAVAAS